MTGKDMLQGIQNLDAELIEESEFGTFRRGKAGGFGKKKLLLILAAALIMLAVSQAGEVGADSGMTDVETRLSATLSQIEGAGSVRAMVLMDETAGAFGEKGAPKVSGVIIVASGAYDLGVRLRLQQAVTTLFSLDADRVEVFSGREERIE